MIAMVFTVLLSGLLPGQAPRGDNLDFHSGKLTGWQGPGFYVTTADPHGPSASLGVCSSDVGRRGRTGMLTCTFVVPPGAGLLRCRAYAARRNNVPADNRLDVRLVADDREIVAKLLKGPADWEPEARLLPRQEGRAPEYAWDLEPLVGRRVRIVLLDDDPRPGCHVFCSGFRLGAAQQYQEHAFARQMRKLERDKRVPPMTRFDSRHFVAWSNADAAFTRSRLRDGEVIYQFFFEHFRRRGFAVQPPATKLLVAVFDSQAGFEAYLGERMPWSVIGIYNRTDNQLVLYDLGQNDKLLANQRKGLNDARTIRSDLDKRRYLETLHRHMGEWSTDSSLTTAMHETAHHLSFNCGLLNRLGDVPAWLSEGLACYCEATDEGRWQGLGEPNPGRARVLAAVVQRRQRFLPLRDLIEKDDWRRDSHSAALGYSQSWALFRFLMKDRPAALRSYLELIYDRRAPDHRLVDFGQVFGANLSQLERRYFDYLRALAVTVR